MSYEDQEAVHQMDQDLDIVMDDFPDDTPPGDEGFDISHASGEHEVFEEFAQGLQDGMGMYISHFTTHTFMTDKIWPVAKLMTKTTRIVLLSRRFIGTTKLTH